MLRPTGPILTTSRIRTQEDIWLILDGKVYDLTEYLEEHPGGAAMLKHAGCAPAFS